MSAIDIDQRTVEANKNLQLRVSTFLSSDTVILGFTLTESPYPASLTTDVHITKKAAMDYALAIIASVQVLGHGSGQADARDHQRGKCPSRE